MRFRVKPGDEVIVPAHSWISTSERSRKPAAKLYSVIRVMIVSPLM